MTLITILENTVSRTKPGVSTNDARPAGSSGSSPTPCFIFSYRHQTRVCNEIFVFLLWPIQYGCLIKIKKTHQFILSKTFRQFQILKYINVLEYFICPPSCMRDISMFYLIHYSLYNL